MAGRDLVLLLTLGVAVGCQGTPQRELNLSFEARVGGSRVTCAQTSSLPAGLTLSIHRMAVFVYDVKLTQVSGAQVAAVLPNNGVWQGNGVGLLDFDDAQCEGGSEGTNTVLTALVPEGEYRGLSFVVGVPFALNHGDPAKAKPPLSDTSMHWGWRGGYKFFRLDGKLGDRSFITHVGSTGCEGEITQITSCSAPNRIQVDLPSFDPKNPSIGVELSGVLQGLLSTAPTEGRLSCMAAPEEPGCPPVMAAFGLNPSGGRQEVFVTP